MLHLCCCAVCALVADHLDHLSLLPPSVHRVCLAVLLRLVALVFLVLPVVVILFFLLFFLCVLAVLLLSAYVLDVELLLAVLRYGLPARHTHPEDRQTDRQTDSRWGSEQPTLYLERHRAARADVKWTTDVHLIEPLIGVLQLRQEGGHARQHCTGEITE